MKINILIAVAMLACFSASSYAATDRNYYVVDASVKQRFDAFNDGKNTYIEAVPGLVVRGATVDGNQYIVYGVPSAIAANFQGKDITLTRGVPPQVTAPTKLIAQSNPNVQQGTTAAIGSNRLIKGVSVASDPSASAAAPAPMQWSIKPSHHSLQQIIEDWASRVGVEVYFKTRDFPLNIKSEKVVSTGDFWAALTLLGESYRNSDAPFQIEPTDFKQIIVHPMRTPKASAVQSIQEAKN